MSISERFKGARWIDLIRDLLTLKFDADKVYELNIKEHKEKRSLSANAYSWVLTDKLAEKMLVAGVKISKQEMHAEMIFRYGQPETTADGNPVIMFMLDEVKATDYYPYAKEIGQGRLSGKPATQWRIYRGSHDYNKQEMSLFINGIVEECKEQGIETRTPDELARMVSLIKEE